MNARIRTLILATLTAALSSTTLAHQGQNHAMTSPVQVNGKDYAFSTSSPLQTGWTTFSFTNTGKELHHFQIARLKAGQTFEGFLADLKARGEAATADITFVGGVGIEAPGSTGTVTVNLDQPGTYVQLCFVPDAKGVPHFALGMTSAFQVTDTANGVAEPRADVAVTLEDFGINIPQEIQAGRQVWGVHNKGPEPHEVMLFRMLPGKTVADLMAMFTGGAPAGMPMGGVQAAATGRTNYADLELTPGDYLLICLIPSPAHQGKSHAELGMVRPFTVK